MLPSPSNMKSNDIPKILDGKMPDPSMLPAVGVGGDHVSVAEA